MLLLHNPHACYTAVALPMLPVPRWNMQAKSPHCPPLQAEALIESCRLQEEDLNAITSNLPAHLPGLARGGGSVMGVATAPRAQASEPSKQGGDSMPTHAAAQHHSLYTKPLRPCSGKLCTYLVVSHSHYALTCFAQTVTLKAGGI